MLVGDPVLMLGWETDQGGTESNVIHLGNTWTTCYLCNPNVGFQVDAGMIAGSSGGPGYYSGKAWGLMSTSDQGSYTNLVYMSGTGVMYYQDVALCTSELLLA